MSHPWQLPNGNVKRRRADSKMEAMQKRAKRRQNIRRGVIVAIVAVIVLGTGALLFAGKTTTTTTTTSTTTTTVPVTTTTIAVKPVSFSPLADPSPAGDLGQAPTLVVPPGAPPTKAEDANLITGTGATVELGDTFTARSTSGRLRVAQGAPDLVDLPGLLRTTRAGRLISGWVYGMVGHEGRRSS